MQKADPAIVSQFGSDQTELFYQIVEIAKGLNVRVFFVGGFVRDMLRGIRSLDADIDLLIEGDAIKFGETLSIKVAGQLKRFPAFVTAKLLLDAPLGKITEIDFASTRTETYPSPGSLPVVELSDLSGDLSRRDFSVNAMALELSAFLRLWNGGDLIKVSEEVIDPFHGRNDLHAKQVRVLHPASFLDDPTRIFRAARYAARLQGNVESGTLGLLTTAVQTDALKTISKQRVINELKKIFAEEQCLTALGLLRAWGVLARIELFAECDWDAFTKAFARAPSMSAHESREDTALALIYLFNPSAKRDDLLRSFGFGKTSFKRWNCWIEKVKGEL